MATKYERPTIQTVPASSIVELLGPVSCGSGALTHGQAPHTGH